jgi:hypothetical protein
VGREVSARPVLLLLMLLPGRPGILPSWGGEAWARREVESQQWYDRAYPYDPYGPSRQCDRCSSLALFLALLFALPPSP